MTPDQKQTLKFIKLADQMKFVERKIILQKNKRENNAEHSYHLAMMVWLFSSFFEKKINLEKALKMALMHDLVEIYSGDVFAYDHEARKTKAQKEKAAAKKLFTQLPKKLKTELENLWNEYEENTTSVSKFVQAMDKIHPLIQNILVEGAMAKKFKITETMIRTYKGQFMKNSNFLTSLFNHLLTSSKKLKHPLKL